MAPSHLTLSDLERSKSSSFRYWVIEEWYSVNIIFPSSIWHCNPSENWKRTEWPQTHLEHLIVKRTLSSYTPEVQILVRFTLQAAIFKLQGWQKIRNALNDFRLRPYSLYDQPFSRYKAVENKKYTEWFQIEMKHLTAQSTLIHTSSPYNPRSPNFDPFHSTTICSWDTRLMIIGKIGNALNGLKMTLST